MAITESPRGDNISSHEALSRVCIRHRLHTMPSTPRVLPPVQNKPWPTSSTLGAIKKKEGRLCFMDIEERRIKTQKVTTKGRGQRRLRLLICCYRQDHLEGYDLVGVAHGSRMAGLVGSRASFSPSLTCSCLREARIRMHIPRTDDQNRSYIIRMPMLGGHGMDFAEVAQQPCNVRPPCHGWSRFASTDGVSSGQGNRV